MRPFVYLLTISVKYLDIDPEDFLARGLTRKEVDFLKPFARKKSKPVHQKPTMYDAEIHHPKLQIMRQSKYFDMFVQNYLVIKRELATKSEADQKKINLLGMLFYVCDKKSGQAPRLNGDDTVLSQDVLAMQEYLIDVNPSASKDYTSAVKGLAEAIMAGERSPLNLVKTA
jgi:hypothetical protein